MNEGESTLELPRRYGKYELLERIGTGGMAEVYRARLGGIAGFEKTVVIKRLHPKHADQLEFVQMFVEEAKLAAEVQHKNVVSVFDLGSLESGEVYMAMEYIAGTDLKNLLRNANVEGKRVAPWLSVHVVCEVLEALAYAHDLVDVHGRPRNIVHCDVTPENVFLSRSGEVKLGDFGVARDDARVSEAFSGHIRGKVPYMSPEQVQGIAPDRRTDIFSAGIVLWECLTQRRLFSANEHPETVRKILYAPRIPPSHFMADVPPALDDIVLDALTVDPSARLSDARAMQVRLLDLLEDLKPRHTLTDVRQSFAGLFPDEAGSAKRPDDVIDLGTDAIVEDTLEPPTESGFAHVTTADRDAARAGLFGPTGLRQLTNPSRADRPPRPDRRLGSTPRRRAAAARATPPPPPEPAAEHSVDLPLEPALSTDIPVPDLDSGDLAPGEIAFAAWLALGGDPTNPPPRLPPTREAAPPPSRFPPPRRHVAPIQSPPGGVETSDILKRMPPRPPLARPSSSTRHAMLPGAPVPAEPPPRVDSSADRHPLWVRAPGGAVLGPHGPSSAFDALRSLLDGAPAPTVAISADRARWIPADRLGPLLGEAPVDTGEDPGPRTSATDLEEHSLTALFGHLTRERASGRLVVIRRTDRGPVRWDLSVDQGHLIGVSRSTEPLEIWSRALSFGVGAHPLTASLHAVIARGLPVTSIGNGEPLEHLRPHRIQALQSQLQDLFAVDRGLVWLTPDAQPPARLGSPIGLLRLLPAIVSRARRTRHLEHTLAPYMRVALVRSERFEAETAALELPEGEIARLTPFGRGYTLEQSLEGCRTPRDKKLGLVIAYLLVELGLLTPYYSQQPSRT